MMSQARIDALTSALVDEKYEQLYLQNFDFYDSVNALVQLLPAWIDGLAAHATTKDAQIQDKKR